MSITLLVFSQLSEPAKADTLDTFDDASKWELILADGVQGQIVQVDGAIRLDYDFSAGAGYCVLHRKLNQPIHPNYRFGLRYRGEGPPNTLEFKLIDPTLENVWWSVERDQSFPTDWTTHTIRRRHVSFAWGPSEGEPLTELGAVEIAVTATQGGKGSVSLDELTYEALPLQEPEPIEPQVRDQNGKPLGQVGPDGSFVWAATAGESIDFLFEVPVEFSAVELDWSKTDASGTTEYEVSVIADTKDLQQLTTQQLHRPQSHLLYAAETEARLVRLTMLRGSAELASIRFEPVERIPHMNAYAQMLADRAPLGSYPEYYKRLTPWTVLGLPDRDPEALMSVNGAVEPAKAGPSVEPFVLLDTQVLAWSDVKTEQTLLDGALPIPTVQWIGKDVTLEITALVSDQHLGSVGEVRDEAGEQTLVRYTLSNTGRQQANLSLALAARPHQVLPAAQFLNTVGGMVDVSSMNMDRDGVSMNGQPFMKTDQLADAFMAHTEPSGSLPEAMRDPSRWSASPQQSPGQFPSGVLRYDFHLKPGQSESVVATLPMASSLGAAIAAADESVFESALHHEQARWQGLLNRFEVRLPKQAQALSDSLRANLAYILINADGAGIRPGSRSYERSWIRDGAMTSAALIALGNQREAREFITWYSNYQYENGKIPCVVDARGPDPVDENDAPGEYIFAVRNSAEAGGDFDTEFARSMYPSVLATVEYIEWMRNQRLTPEYVHSQDPIMRASAGLMPESISHEGYAAKPMHSYWDDFWVYRGLWDAAHLAEELGEIEDHARISKLATSFGESIRSSVDLATRTHGIEYVPGCVELGDFDATSTSIAFYPTGTAEVLDPSLLEQTFEKAWDATEDRINGGAWEGMTPYEVRTVGTFIRLGWVQRAHQYMDWLMSLQAPGGWRQWGEIAYKNNEPCLFVGDMPHTWVGSGAILSILSMFVYEEADRLVLAAGIPSDWLDGGEDIGISGIVTRYGTLAYSVSRDEDTVRIQLEPGCNPAGGFRISINNLVTNEYERVSEIMVDGKVQRYENSGSIDIAATARSVMIRFD